MTSTLTHHPLSQRLELVGRQIGNTPLMPLGGIFHKPGVSLYAKVEWQQFGQSVKARAAYSIISDAVRTGRLDTNKVLLDATSGNTGIAYAAIGAAVGLRVRLVLPANVSAARKRILRALGAELVFSSEFEGTDGAQRLARELVAFDPHRYYYADQYSNPANYLAHVRTTSREIWAQTGGEITHFVAGLGTTGTFTGTTLGLKDFNPDIQAIELQPDLAMHALEGWKHLETAAVPKIYRPSIADARVEVSTDAAHRLIREVARKEGLLLSPSAAANLAGAIQVAQGLDQGTVVTVFADNADKYSDVYDELYA
jgi:S-sulfo-L-cysteine synthase (O-acetyl-L-serine-dependent)